MFMLSIKMYQASLIWRILSLPELSHLQLARAGDYLPSLVEAMTDAVIMRCLQQGMFDDVWWCASFKLVYIRL